MLTAEQRQKVIQAGIQQGLDNAGIRSLLARANERVAQRAEAQKLEAAQAQDAATAQQLSQDQSLLGRAQTLGTNIAESLTFGNAAELTAGAGELAERLGLSEPRDFADRVAGAESSIDRLSTANPRTALLGDVTGSVAPALATGGVSLAANLLGRGGARAAATAAPTLAGTIGRSAAVGAGAGLVADDGQIGEDGDFLALGDRARNAAVGGALGAGLPAAGGLIKQAARLVPRTIGAFSGFSNKAGVINNFLDNPEEILRRSNSPELSFNRLSDAAQTLVEEQKTLTRNAQAKFGQAIDSKTQIDISDFKKNIKDVRAEFSPDKAVNRQQELDFKDIQNKIDNIIKVDGVEESFTTQTVPNPNNIFAPPVEVRTPVTRNVTREIPDVVSGRQADEILKTAREFQVNPAAASTSPLDKRVAGKVSAAGKSTEKALVPKEVREEFKLTKQRETDLKKAVGDVRKPLTPQERGEKFESFLVAERASSKSGKSTFLNKLDKESSLPLRKEALDLETVSAAAPDGSRLRELFNSNKARGVVASLADGAFKVTARGNNALQNILGEQFLQSSNVGANALINRLLQDRD
jgi:hypothetical protein